MTPHLSAGQFERLEAELLRRRDQLQGRLTDPLGGASRAEHAHEVLMQDAREASQREGEREIDSALSDIEQRELAEVEQALRRLHAEDGARYGHCIDCAGEVPFERLQAEPQALRCIDCEAAHEAARRRLS